VDGTNSSFCQAVGVSHDARDVTIALEGRLPLVRRTRTQR
jgi:hypothetical protein